MPDTIACMDNNLCELDLIHYRDKISILYGIKCEDGEVYFWEYADIWMKAAIE